MIPPACTPLADAAATVAVVHGAAMVEMGASSAIVEVELAVALGIQDVKQVRSGLVSKMKVKK